MLRIQCLVAVLISYLTVQVAWGADTTLPGPGTVTGFRLTDATGKVIQVAAQSEKQLTVVCFLGTECPLARHYGRRLNELATLFATKEVRFVGVNSNSQDSPQEVVAFTKELAITFPILKDPGNQVADQFGAKYMAEVFVLDQTLSIRYRGRVDDQYQPGVTRSQPTREDLRIALEELLAGMSVSVPETEVSGCMIGRVRIPRTGPAAKVTFCNQVSRILNQHCVECHRPGEIGPFSLTDYNEVTGWADTILETIDAGRMPPWNANPKVGHFQNARVMSTADKQVLREWVAAGLPYGDVAELPPPEEFSVGWRLNREPDLVLKMRNRPFQVPAAGTVEYQYFVVDPKFDEDRWVSAAQVIPGSRSTVHHCIVFVRPPDGSDVRGVGYLTGYVPGQRSFTLPTGYARKVPAGSKFVFQMHYTPNGTEQADLTQLGMTFLPESQVKHEVFTLLGINQQFEIPPNAADFPVEGSVKWIPKRAELLAIIPHMHVRGKSIQAFGRSGTTKTPLLDVVRYDFNWQHVYELSQPLPLNSLDSLEFTARFDNSKQNPANPDPSQTVMWGDQTWEEMAIAFFEVAEPRSADAEPEPATNKQRLVVRTGNDTVQSESTATFVAEFFQRFDKNGDGIVEPQETPLAFRRFGFYRYDVNGDGQLNREEIESAAASRQKK
ncbi:MAG: redoxin domain-containing protein [Planctomycetes bacterium]|nr:redoxin domain-containing protein [Planctomycetota bacterium]